MSEEKAGGKKDKLKTENAEGHFPEDPRFKQADAPHAQEKMIRQLLVHGDASDKNLMEGFTQVFRNFDVNLTNTTFSQMKTSGSLRYILNTELTGELQKYYDVMCQEVLDEGKVSREYLKDYMLPFYLKHVKAQDVDPMQGTFITSSAILNRTPESDQELLNITEMYRVVNLGISEQTNKPAAKQASALIGMIKKNTIWNSEEENLMLIFNDLAS